MALSHYHARLLASALRNEGFQAYTIRPTARRKNRLLVVHNAPDHVLHSMMQTFGLESV